MATLRLRSVNEPATSAAERGRAGADNNGVGSSAGGAGGGSVLIRAGALAGAGTIDAYGAAGDVSGQDGSGGGGGGGTVVVLTSESGAASGLGGLTVNAAGGAGGNATHPAAHGPGGGGGGGAVFTTAPPASTDVSGGANGTHFGDPYGANPGTPGISSTSVPLGDAPGTNTGSQCIDVSVTKSIVPTDVVPGQPVTYTVVATNQGPFPTSGTATISVIDALPADVLTPTWTCSASAGSSCGAASGSGSLATTADLTVGGTATYTITGTLSPTFNGTLSNTATVAGPAAVPELNAADNTDTVDATEGPLTIDKSSDASGPVVPGQVITYTLEIENNGASELTGVSVADVLPAGLTYVPESTTVVGDRRNTVTEGFEGGAAGWAATGSCTTGDWIAADPVNTTYQVGAAHTGALALITAQNPAGFIGTDDVDGGSCTTTSTTYPVAGGGNLSIWYSFAQRDTGDDPTDGFLLEASFNGGGSYSTIVSFGDVARAKGWTEATIGVPAAATGVVIRATATDGPGPGDIVEGALDDFAMTTTTTGPFDNVPGGANPDLADGTPPALITTAENFFIPVGGSITVTYQATVDTAATGTLTNVATADSNEAGPATDSESVVVGAASLDLTKTQTSGPDPVTGLPATLGYTITVENTGDVTLTDVTLTDTLPDGSAGTPSGPTETLTSDGIFEAGETWTYTISYGVTQGDIDAGTDLTNVAGVSAEAPGGDPGDPSDDITDTDSAITTVDAPPALSVDKPAPMFSIDADSSGDVSVGDTLTYTVTATNSGPTTLTSVVVSDPLITVSGGSSPCGLVAPGGICTLVGTYVVTAADVAAGQIDNTVPGGANLTNVVVSDPLIAVSGGSSPCGLVAPGGTCTLVGTYVVTAVDVAAGSIVNTATADSDQTAPVTDDETVVVPSPSLGVDKPAPVFSIDSDSSGDVSVGDTLTYTITATNDGTANLTNVVVSDPLIAVSHVCGDGGRCPRDRSTRRRLIRIRRPR